MIKQTSQANKIKRKKIEAYYEKNVLPPGTRDDPIPCSPGPRIPDARYVLRERTL